jgi:cytochrome b pre-mRNA-processing protein 3
VADDRQSPTNAGRAWRWLRALRPDSVERARRQAALHLYLELVKQARRPAFYRGLGVPDTPEGRFEMVALHVALAWRRLRLEGAAGNAMGQELFDLMVADLDESLRQIGIGDLSVGKQMKRLAGHFYARLKALDEVFAAAPAGSLRALLRTNVYHGGTPPSEPQLAALAGYVIATDEALRAHSVASLLAGRLRIGAPQEPRGEAATQDRSDLEEVPLSGGEARARRLEID